MAIVLDNTPLGAGMFRLVVALDAPVSALPGQFCMISVEGFFLPRPISIHDLPDDGDKLTFLIHTRGEGTHRMARAFTPGQEIAVSPPLGNGLAPTDAALTLIGGGAGTAPLFYFARRWRAMYPNRPVRVYLGFGSAPFALDVWQGLGIAPTVNVGGLITDDVDFEPDGVVFACGPDVMMRAAYAKATDRGRFYVSMESRMACGIGACLGCCHPVGGGNKRVCRDGPVFLGVDVYES